MNNPCLIWNKNEFESFNGIERPRSKHNDKENIVK